MAISVFDLFKVGIGPSSSHTVGPMRAAALFTHALENHGHMPQVTRIAAELYGSLGATGKGHGSDKAVLLGLSGYEPDTVDVDQVPGYIEAIRRDKRIVLAGKHAVAFDEKADLKMFRKALPLHANGLRFAAFDAAGIQVHEATYYSVGGGFAWRHSAATFHRRRSKDADEEEDDDGAPSTVTAAVPGKAKRENQRGSPTTNSCG